MSTLDWGWSLSGSHGSGAQAQQADTSGSAILAALLGGGGGGGGGGGDTSASASASASPDATTQSTGPNPNAPGTNPAGPMGSTPATSGPATPTATYTPSSRDRWQGGQADPRGTQDPQTGRQLGGRPVDPTYQTDATGRPLTAAEQQYWRDYDTARANASTREQAGYAAYKANQASAGVNGQKAVFDARTKTWSLYDPTAKKWTDGIGQNDIYGQLTGNLKQENPEWWWGDTARSAVNQNEYQNLRYANQYQGVEQGNRQQTRYSTYGL